MPLALFVQQQLVYCLLHVCRLVPRLHSVAFNDAHRKPRETGKIHHVHGCKGWKGLGAVHAYTVHSFLGLSLTEVQWKDS